MFFPYVIIKKLTAGQILCVYWHNSTGFGGAVSNRVKENWPSIPYLEQPDASLN